MKHLTMLGLLAAIAIGGLNVGAQESNPPGEGQGTEPDPLTTPREGQGGEPESDDIFIPSEEVQAAEELTFPVNI